MRNVTIAHGGRHRRSFRATHNRTAAAETTTPPNHNFNHQNPFPCTCCHRDHLAWRKQSDRLFRRNRHLLQLQQQRYSLAFRLLLPQHTRCLSTTGFTTGDIASLSLTKTEKANTHTTASSSSSDATTNLSDADSSDSTVSSTSPSYTHATKSSSLSPSSPSSSSSPLQSNNPMDKTTATEIEDRFLALEMATRQCLLEKQLQQHNKTIGTSHSRYQSLLQQWHDLLPDLDHYYNYHRHHQQQQQQPQEATTNTTAEAFDYQKRKHREMIVQAVERMEDLFSELVVHPPIQQQQQASTKATTTTMLPLENQSDSAGFFYWLLSPSSSTTTHTKKRHSGSRNKATYQAMLQAVSRYHPSGAAALRVLQAWNEALQGDFEQAPRKDDCHAVLYAYAHQDDSRSDDNYVPSKQLAFDDPVMVDLMTGADVAMEIVHFLQEAWNPSMRPDAITHALALQCMARPLAVLSATTSTTTTATGEQNEEGNDPHQELLSTLRKNMRQTRLEFMKQLKVWMVASAPSGLFQKRTTDAKNELLGKQEQVICILGALNVVWQHSSTIMSDDDVFAARNEKDSSEWVKLWKQIITMQDLDANNHQVELVLGQSALTILKRCLNQALVVKTNSDEAAAMCQRIDVVLSILERFQHPFLPHDRHYDIAINARKSMISDTRRDLHIREWIAQIEKIHKVFHMSPHDFLYRNQDRQEASRSFVRLMRIYHERGQDDRVEQIWDDIAKKREIIPMTPFSVSIVLKSLARQKQLRAAQKAQTILSMVLALDPSDPHYFKPLAQHYGSVMVALRHTEHPRARSICQHVMDLLVRHSKDDPEVQPSTIHYAALIGSHAWIHPGQKKQAAAVLEEEQDSLFKTIDEALASRIDIDLALYETMLLALCRIGSVEADARALKLLDELILAFEEGGRDGLKPTSPFISKLMFAWSRSGTPRAAEQCESLLRRLEVAYEKSGGDSWMKPSADCYKTLIHAYINLGLPDSAELAEKVLDRMESAALDDKADYPNKMIFAEIITAHSKSESPDAAAKAEAVLTRMAKAYMFGNEDARPDGKICSALLYSWARSSLPNKASRCKSLLDRMCLNFRKGDRNMRPLERSFITVLNACAYAVAGDEKDKANLVRIALATVDEMEAIIGQASELAFVQLSLVIRRHVDDEKERERLGAELLRRCAQAGFVSTAIIRSIRKLAPSLEPDQNQMPRDWKRNVK